ncbi:COG4705 family protein [Novosphingobium malaysiense]|uniref:Membrane protein n=1 Tax=Novosphingobium malaysiense TaxID=1348853 RepID=A0A0B1ZMV8_9SPHN|nr:membrane protein [Novosphingobium malaysiense]KHK91931.1 membrane protein [Novosphingobium malaysiense]
MNDAAEQALTKVPAVTLGFWIIKILATTFGETAGDTVSMSLGWGYLAGSGLFAMLLALLVAAQIGVRRFHPWLYWVTIIASTTVGTTMSDFATRSMGIGYPGGSVVLLGLVLVSLLIWWRDMGSINVSTVHRPRVEIYYWLTITFSQTLGTALGDWIADGSLGYLGAAVVFGSLLAITALAYFRNWASHVALFWIAFILTRPLGAVVGDFLDKPVANGGLALGRAAASAVLFLAIATLVLALPQRAGRRH